MKNKNVLVISLGRSPPVVPETIDALMERGIKIDKTYILTTSDEKIQNESLPIIIKDFQLNYEDQNMELDPYNCFIKNSDIETREDTLELMMRTVYKIFKKERKKKSNIYVSIAGGRKTMSSAMALLSQLFNVKAITHVLVPPEIEKKGRFHYLNQLAEEMKNERPDLSLEDFVGSEQVQALMHPQQKNLILFPVIGISWMLPDIVKVFEGNFDALDNKDMLNILQENELIDKEYNPTLLGNQLFQLISEI